MESVEGGLNFLLESGDKPEKGEKGVDVEMGGGGVTFLITLQFNHIYSVCVCVCVCGGGGVE